MATTLIFDNREKYTKHYSDAHFWNKMKSLAREAEKKVAKPALLLYYVLASRDVSVKHKAAIIGALGYLILPIDLIPDVVPIAGYTDDLAALMSVIDMVANDITPEIKAKADSRLKELFG